jgi:hypothetical protein
VRVARCSGVRALEFFRTQFRLRLVRLPSANLADRISTTSYQVYGQRRHAINREPPSPLARSDGIYDHDSLRLAVRKYRELFGPKLRMPFNHTLCLSFTVVNRALWERAAMVAEPHFPPL